MRAMTMRSVMWLAATALVSMGASPARLSVEEKAEVSAPPEKVWETIKDFDGLHKWHPAVASTEIAKGKGNAKGAVRVLTTKDGAKITEELVSHSDRNRNYRYRIIESPLPVTDYVSTIKVAKSAGGSTVVWNSQFKAKQGASDEDAKKSIDGIYTAGLDNLKALLNTKTAVK